MAIDKKLRGMLDENGHIPVWGARQSEPSSVADSHRYIEAKEKIIANNFSSDIVNSMWYSPELMPDIWQMPKSKNELLKWCRFFYNTDPYVQAITNMHALFPFSNFQAIASNEKITEYYKKVAFTRNFNLFDHILDMSLAYAKFGESIVMGQEETVNYDGVPLMKWKSFVPFEPEVINIYKSALERKENYTLVITPEFKEEIRQQRNKGKEVHPLLGNAIDYNKTEVDLDGQFMSKIINKTDPSAVRGTSPLQCLLRMLMFQDKVNLLKITAIDRYRNPLEIWKIGDMANSIVPDMNMLKGFETMIKEAKNNPPYALFIPPYVNFEVAGYSSQKTMFDYKDDYEHVRDAIMVGMGVSKDLIMGEQKGWGNTKQLSLHKLMMMYSTTRTKFDNWLTNEFYYPMANKNNFFTASGDLDLPQIIWEKDLDVDRSTPDDMFKLWDKGLISTKTLFSVYKGLDYEQEAELLTAEIGSRYDDKRRIRNRDIQPIDKEEPPTTGAPGAGNKPPAGGGEPTMTTTEEPTEELTPAEETTVPATTAPEAAPTGETPTGTPTVTETPTTV